MEAFEGAERMLAFRPIEGRWPRTSAADALDRAGTRETTSQFWGRDALLLEHRLQSRERRPPGRAFRLDLALLRELADLQGDLRLALALREKKKINSLEAHFEARAPLPGAAEILVLRLRRRLEGAGGKPLLRWVAFAVAA